MRAAGRPDSTITLRVGHLRHIFAALEAADPWTITTEQLVDYLSLQPWKPNTRRSYRASLRQFYTWAQATGRRPDNPGVLIPSVSVPRGLPRPTPEQVYRQALIDADDRVRLMIKLAAHCGLRRGEIARVHSRDVGQDLLGWNLRVRGKGGHERVVPLTNELARELRDLPAGWAFPSSARAGAPLTPAHVGKLVSAALPDAWTCHTLRHRCATVAYWANKDIRAVQELLGHAKADTTALYTKVPFGDIRAAVTAAAA